MDNKKNKELLMKLREIFQVEAAERIEAIAAGLIALERAKDSEYISIVEGVFREAHSLKGAAGSVNLVAVQTLCRDLESLFSEMKHEGLKLSTEMLDVIHPALGVLSTLCSNPAAAPSPMEGGGGEQETLAALRRIVLGLANKRAG